MPVEIRPALDTGHAPVKCVVSCEVLVEAGDWSWAAFEFHLAKQEDQPVEQEEQAVLPLAPWDETTGLEGVLKWAGVT
jgi:hypothetical protein